jgi:hypothetical protein
MGGDSLAETAVEKIQSGVVRGLLHYPATIMPP